MGGKGGGGTTTVQKSDPWEGQQPYLTKAFKQADKLYSNGSLAPDYYSGQTVADQSAWTKAALNMQAKAAQNMAKNPLMTGASSAVRNIMSGNALDANSGLNTLESLAKKIPITQAQALGGQGLSTLSGLAKQATGYGNTGLSALNNYAGTNFNAGNSALTNLQGTTGTGINAGNAGLNTLNTLAAEDNPYIDALYQRANNQAQASLDSNFNRAGRYGSGAHEAAAADAANNLADQMYSNLYTQRANTAANAANAYTSGINAGINAQQAAGNLYNAGNQLGVSAAQDAANAYNAALGQRISAAQGAGGLYNTGISNYLNAYGQQADAAQQAGSLYNTGIGQQAAASTMAQQLAQQPYTDAAMLSEAGGIKDDYNQQLINAAIDKYNYQANQPLQALSTYNQLIQGSYGGTSTATGQQGSGSTLGSVLGGGLTGAGLGAGIASLGGATGAAALTSPWALGGAAIGGLLGLL